MTLAEELRTELSAAMRRRDKPVVAALRSALGDLANAEAVPVAEGRTRAAESAHVAGGRVGVGAAEAERRQVGADAQRAIVARHRTELLDHAERLARLCRRDEADGARRSAALLGTVLQRAAEAPG